jgi:hypothetical protein
MDEKIEDKEQDIIDLIDDSCRRRKTVTIEVAGRRWRVLKHAVDACPVDYASAWTSPVSREQNGWRCFRCGAEVSKEVVSRWTPSEDCLCQRCREAPVDEPFIPHCTSCHLWMLRLLPFEVGGQLRLVWCCPLHHVFVIGGMEGVR